MDSKNSLQRVINFSGGKSSALMTILEYKPGDIVLFCDTGREHPKTYKFLNDFEAFEKIPITRLSYPGGWGAMLYNNAKNKYLPNRVARYCTKHLKILTARKYLLSIGVKRCENMIGFRSDEPQRVAKYDPRWVGYMGRFPLNERGIDKNQVNNYWENKPYTLEIPSILGNCDLCFLKGKNAIISILISYPELADRWIQDEKLTNGTYIKGISYTDLLNIAKSNLFADKQINLDTTEAAFNCSCTS